MKKVNVGDVLWYDGQDHTSFMKAQKVEVVQETFAGFDTVCLVQGLEQDGFNSQAISLIHLQQIENNEDTMDSLEDILNLEKQTTTDKGDNKMDFTKLTTGDVVIMTSVSMGDMLFAGLNVGDRVTVIAGLGEKIPPSDIIRDELIGTTNEEGVVIGVTDRGTPALLGEDNSFEME